MSSKRLHWVLRAVAWGLTKAAVRGWIRLPLAWRLAIGILDHDVYVREQRYQETQQRMLEGTLKHFRGMALAQLERKLSLPPQRGKTVQFFRYVRSTPPLPPAPNDTDTPGPEAA